MNKEIFIIIFVSFFALGFLPFTETIVFGHDEDFSYKEINKLERFGTQGTNTKKYNKKKDNKKDKKKGQKTSSSSSTSTNELLNLMNVNKKNFNESVNKRIYRIIKSNITVFQKQFESFINTLISDIKKNKEITDRIILGRFFDSEQFQNFKKDLYNKLSKAKMESLYEPIKEYFQYLNKKFFPGLFKKLLIKKKFVLSKEDIILLKDIIHELLNTNMEFKLSEFVFMELLSSRGEHTTFNLATIKKMLKQNPQYLQSKNPMYNVKHFIPLLKVRMLENMRFESFLFYLSFLYRKFHRQIIMFRKLSLIQEDNDLKEVYKTFLVKTGKFVSNLNGASLTIFKRNS